MSTEPDWLLVPATDAPEQTDANFILDLASRFVR